MAGRGRPKVTDVQTIECWVTFWVRLSDGERLILPDTMGYSEDDTKHRFNAKYGELHEALKGSKAGLYPLHKRAEVTVKF